MESFKLFTISPHSLFIAFLSGALTSHLKTEGVLSFQQDIIQQHLCCPDTVSLIEKCTRFHIHCAHHLCEEHISAFDAKINNENMTKCLQSLKEMYQDLATHQVYCCREAEFRQYSVLLRLNDGDILRSDAWVTY